MKHKKPYPLVLITDRKICDASLTEVMSKFLKKHNAGEALSNCKIDFVVLREKDLNIEEYRQMYKLCKEITDEFSLSLYTNTYLIENVPVHLPYSLFVEMAEKGELPEKFGVSSHSLEEAIFAEKKGASYLFFSNVFETKCKVGLKGKGLDALRNVCSRVNIPVYALGGIDEKNMDQVMETGAYGVAIRSLVVDFVG